MEQDDCCRYKTKTFRNQWKIFSKKLACDWSKSKDSGKLLFWFSAEHSNEKDIWSAFFPWHPIFPTKRHLIRFNLWLLSESVTRLVTALLATTIPLIYRNMSLWTLSSKRIFPRLNNHQLLWGLLRYFSDGMKYVTTANISDKEYEISTESYGFNLIVRKTVL